MKGIKAKILSRGIVLALILMILVAILLSYLLPQRLTTTTAGMEEWHRNYPFLVPWIERFGLDHIFTTPWFAVLLSVFLLSLLLSTADQVRRAYRLTFGGEGGGGRRVETNLPLQAVSEILRERHYFPTFRGEGRTRYLKQPWGYWGNVLLHLGIVVVIGASLLLVLSETRGLLHLMRGEIHQRGGPWIVEEGGIMARRFILPAAVRLDAVSPEYWETDDLKQMSTHFSFLDPDGRETRYILAINRTVNDRGLRIYQGRTYGDGFYVTLRKGGGEEYNMLLQIEHPERRDRPGYGNFSTEGVPYLIKAKYFADAEEKTVATVRPLLFLRLVEEWGEVVDEISLTKGERKSFGPYEAELVEVAPWSGIIFVRSRGMMGVFAGFLIIVVGVSLTYFMPPRECVVEKKHGGYILSWRALRFAEFYEEEFLEISDRLKGGVAL